MDTTKWFGYIDRGDIPPGPPDCAGEFNWDWVPTHADHTLAKHLGLAREGQVSGTLLSFQLRQECTERGMWALVDNVWTRLLADWIGGRRVLEIMAGRGWLAKALDACGVEVLGTDDYSWDDRRARSGMVFPVTQLDAVTACEKLGTYYDVLLVSWPPLNDRAICRAAAAWGPDKPIVYVGEGDGGCCAPAEFWQQFNEIAGAPEIPLTCWRGIHDRVWIGRFCTEDGKEA